MNTMQTTQPLLSTGARLSTALAVVGIVAAAWMAAGHESEKAVQASAAAFGPRPVYVTLPSVEIVARRKADAPETAYASAGQFHATNEL
jgi:hypothetical protein